MVISEDTANLLPRNESSHQLSGNLIHGWTETGHGVETRTLSTRLTIQIPYLFFDPI
jgi:hypothetical protein